MDLQDLQLNDAALEGANDLIEFADEYGAQVHEIAGAAVVDCGVEAPGSLRAGRIMAEVCMADRAYVHVQQGRLGRFPCLQVSVEVEEPAVACLLSQYAGWKVSLRKFFAMTSGPIRAIIADEPVFTKLGYRESSEVAVAVMETRQLPNEEVIEHVLQSAGVEPENLVVLVAPTASIAGSLQVVARSVETCLHKLFELGYDVTRIRSATGSAWLPPIPKDDLVAIGRTNDSILFAGEVCLWVEGDDHEWATLGPRVPSSASADYGVPFADVFKKAGGDFYKIDPMLFSPALVYVNNLTTGNVFLFGKSDHELLAKTFFGGDPTTNGRPQ